MTSESDVEDELLPEEALFRQMTWNKGYISLHKLLSKIIYLWREEILTEGCPTVMMAH